MEPVNGNSTDASGASADALVDLEEPLLSSADGHKHGEKRCSWQATTTALLSLQLGWGLWLFPAGFARLGWIPALGECLADSFVRGLHAQQRALAATAAAVAAHSVALGPCQATLTHRRRCTRTLQPPAQP